MNPSFLPRPNCFLVGAPKAGTTAAVQFLASHPAIFFSPVKEPHYFSHEFPGIRRYTSEADYLELFREADPAHQLIGEASVSYLYSQCAARMIREFNPDARLLVMVRNPVDLVYSQHSQLVFTGDETVADFRAAWELQEARAAGHKIPIRCRMPAFLQYRDVGSLGLQLERLLEVWPAKQVHTTVFDDLCARPDEAGRSLLAFLGLDPVPEMEFNAANPNKVPRSLLAAQLTHLNLECVSPLLGRIKRTLRIHRLGLRSRLRRWNRVEQTRPPLDPAFHAYLTEEFLPDIHKLESLLHRDLSPWYSSPPSSSSSLS